MLKKMKEYRLLTRAALAPGRAAQKHQGVPFHPADKFLTSGTVSPKLVSNFIGCWRCDW
jgi:hypothetical protein